MEKSKYYLEKTIEKNSHDVLLKRNLGTIMAVIGQLYSALYIFEHLTKQFPQNSLFSFDYFTILYSSAQKEQAAHYLAKAVYLVPNITDLPLWDNLKNNDFAFYQKVTKQILERLNDSYDTSPIAIAQQGKLYLSLGDTLQARNFFEEASILSPNLPKPWFYLSQIAENRGDQKKAEVFLNMHCP